MSYFKDAYELLTTRGTNGFIILLAIAFLYIIYKFFCILIDEDKSSLWRARIAWLLLYINRTRELEKKYISNDINGKVNLARRTLHYGKEVLPKAISIDWVDTERQDSYLLSDGEFVVRLNPASGQDKNIVMLTTAVVERTSLEGIRHIVPQPLARAIDLNLVKNILLKIQNKKALEWFFSYELKPLIDCDQNLATQNNFITEIDDKGLFTRVLLIELEEFSKNIMGLSPQPYMEGAVEGLVEFLYKIATKNVGQDVPLRYYRAHIRIGFILVANTSKILKEGVSPYVLCMNINIDQDIKTVYVIVFDKSFLAVHDSEAYKKFRDLTSTLDTTILHHSYVTKDFEEDYYVNDVRGARRKAKCFRYIISTAT